MDALKAQIQARKRQAETPSDPAAKYVRRGDLARKEAPAPEPAPEPQPVRAPTPPPAPAKDKAPEAKEGFSISNDEAVLRLRQKGEPIRLFAETDKERRLRLRALELIEVHSGDPHGRNDFVKALQGAESDLTREKVQGKAKDEGTSKPAPHMREGIGMDSLLDLELIRTDTARVYPIIYYTLKGLYNEWGETLDKRPEDVRHSTQGRMVSATHVQTGEYLKPLFKVAPDVLMRIAEIVHYMQQREYRMANDSYLQLSIGNAPWPIVSTSVPDKKSCIQPTLLMVSRKYIQSLKRLMTFAQTKYPPEDVSKLMG